MWWTDQNKNSSSTACRVACSNCEITLCQSIDEFGELESAPVSTLCPCTERHFQAGHKFNSVWDRRETKLHLPVPLTGMTKPKIRFPSKNKTAPVQSSQSTRHTVFVHAFGVVWPNSSCVFVEILSFGSLTHSHAATAVAVYRQRCARALYIYCYINHYTIPCCIAYANALHTT